MSREAECLAETLKWEGGYSDDPYDPGGKTMHGIIQSEYDRYRRSKGLPTQWVKLIGRDEELEIYKAGYWDPVRADELPAGVDLVMFDFAVNSGPGRAIMTAQAALGIAVDGHLGPATMQALQSGNPTDIINKIMDARLAFLQRLNTWWRFGVGWSRRCAGVRQAALEAVGHTLDQSKPQPLKSTDKQSATQGRAYGPIVIPAADGPHGYDPDQVPRPPVVATATSSKTVGSMIVGLFLWLAQKFSDVVNGVLDSFSDMVGEIDGNLSSLKMAFGWFRAEWETIALYAAIACCIVVVVRHIILKQQAKVANAVPDSNSQRA